MQDGWRKVDVHSKSRLPPADLDRISSEGIPPAIAANLQATINRRSNRPSSAAIQTTINPSDPSTPTMPTRTSIILNPDDIVTESAPVGGLKSKSMVDISINAPPAPPLPPSIAVLRGEVCINNINNSENVTDDLIGTHSSEMQFSTATTTSPINRQENI